MRIAAVDTSVGDKLHETGVCLRALMFSSSWPRLFGTKMILAAHPPLHSLLPVTLGKAVAGREHILREDVMTKRKNHPKVLLEVVEEEGVGTVGAQGQPKLPKHPPLSPH